jgi:hypothetical protein
MLRSLDLMFLLNGLPRQSTSKLSALIKHGDLGPGKTQDILEAGMIFLWQTNFS